MAQDPPEMSDYDMEDLLELLDQLVMKQLLLLQQKLTLESRLESDIHHGSMRLAKSRYIMGHHAVSSLQFSKNTQPTAKIICKTRMIDGVPHMDLVRSDENSTNPIRWFGVLLPQDMHRAQRDFKNAIKHSTDCVNIQLKLHKNSSDIKAVRKCKKFVRK